jgi:hypothetical protein
MQWFFLFLSTVWTVIFGFMFFLLFPDGTQQQTHFKLNPPPAQQQQQQIQQMQPPAPCANRIEQPKPLAEGDEPVLLDKNAPPTHLEIKGAEEIPKTEEQLRQELERQAQTSFEQRLVSILVKINIAACTTCTRDDKKIILQLKMMKALLDGKPKEALKYSAELNKYLNNAKIEIIPSKPKPTLKPAPKPKPKPQSDDSMPLPPPLD